MKKVLLVASILASFSASAEMKHIPCEFAELEGKKIRFLEVDPNTRFQNREDGLIYPYWVNDRFNPEKVNVDDLSFRQAKLDTSKFYRRLESSGVPGDEPSFVRYYKTITEKCDVVWARIDESDNNFAKYFDEKNHLMDGSIPWEKEGESLSVQFNDEHSKLYARVGKSFYVKPHASNEPHVGLTLDKMHQVSLSNHEKLKLVDVQPNSFIMNGVMIGTVTLKVKRENGEVVIIPWDTERLTHINPLSSRNVKAKHKPAIASEQIHFGMNAEEIIAAWGQPDYVRYNPMYEAAKGKSFFVQNDRYPYGDSFKEFQVTQRESRMKSGDFQEWTYKDRLPEGKVLVLDHEGNLDKLFQTKQVIKNEIHVDVAYPKIK